MLWLAALPATPCAPDALRATIWWALGHTPRVAQHEGAVLLELSASRRLLGGWLVLRERLTREAAELGVARLAWAPVGRAALALARAGVAQAGVLGAQGDAGPPALWHPVLDRLPLAALGPTADAALLPLAQLGCHTLGALRALPRAGVAKRFGAELLLALDRCYGDVSEGWRWETVPERFEVRRELPWRQDNALALLHEAEPLLLQLRGWLVARRAGVRALTLHWRHDTFRARGSAEGGSMSVRSAEAMSDLAHLRRLLGQRLARHSLQAPVAELRLSADEVMPITEHSRSWLPDAPAETERSQRELLETLAARLGPERVLRPRLRPDHRPEHMSDWVSASDAPATRVRAPAHASWPQPVFLLPEPLRLVVREYRPHYRGALQLLLGPQRIEGGWWHRDDSADRMFTVFRDYWVAQSPQAGVLCVFRTRLDGEHAWYLHGFFA